MRLKIKNRFWIIPNSLLSDENISWKAKWLYWYLQSKPDDWNFSAERISKEAKDWLDSTKSWLKELELAWYLERKKFKNEKWQWDIEYPLFDTPFDWNFENQGGKSTLENNKTRVENPSTENPPTKKERINNIILSKDNIIEQAQKNFSYNISKKEKIENSENELEKEFFEKEKIKSYAADEEYWNPEINNMLSFLKKIIWVSDFKESKKMQRIMGKNILNLWKKIWKEEFQIRMKNILENDFKAQNCNSLSFLFKELKAFIHSPILSKQQKSFENALVVSDNF